MARLAQHGALLQPFKPSICFETNLVLLILQHRRSEAGVHERLTNRDTQKVVLLRQEGRPSRTSG
jgi:hypothetical protein